LVLVAENGQILISDQKDESINISRLADNLNNFFSSAENSAYIKIGKGETVTLHKQNSIITILKPQHETTPHIRLIGITSATGNWFFMKMTLKKLLDEIVRL